MLKLLLQWACTEVGSHSTRSDFSSVQNVFVAALALLTIRFLQYNQLFMLLESVLTWKVQVSQKKLQLHQKLGVMAVVFVEPKGSWYLGYRGVGRHTDIIPLEHLLQSGYICMLRQCAHWSPGRSQYLFRLKDCPFCFGGVNHGIIDWENGLVPLNHVAQGPIQPGFKLPGFG